MALQSGFFNSINGDRAKDAEFFSRYFASFIGNGVFPNPSDNFQVMANNDMFITVKKGSAWINGMFAFDDYDYAINLDVADGVLDRIDRVVLRRDVLDREPKILVKKGTFASSPVAPLLQRDADAYEIALADIYIGKGAISITQANVTDTRLNNELCGIVHGVVDQVDTTTLFNQYQAWYTQAIGDANVEIGNIKTQFQQDFNDWFAIIQGALEGDVAGNLLNMITQIQADLSQHTEDEVRHIKSTERDSWNNLNKIKKNISILANNWVDDTEGSGFWINEILDSDITQNTVVDVNIHLADLDKARKIKSSNLSSDGKVTIYAQEQLEEDILCDIKLVRQVGA